VVAFEGDGVYAHEQNLTQRQYATDEHGFSRIYFGFL
jgi:hypothetical protein